jgi:hypothetical protein
MQVIAAIRLQKIGKFAKFSHFVQRKLANTALVFLGTYSAVTLFTAPKRQRVEMSRARWKFIVR